MSAVVHEDKLWAELKRFGQITLPIDPVFLAALAPGLIVPPQTFADGLSNGGAGGALADFATHNSLFVAPFPLRMIVQTGGACGFSTGTGQLTAEVRDEAGTSISVYPNSEVVDITAGAIWYQFSMSGKKDYGAGATVGYRLAYRMNSGGGHNIYIQFGTVVTFARI
jgi:hypothetical protein